MACFIPMRINLNIKAINYVLTIIICFENYLKCSNSEYLKFMFYYICYETEYFGGPTFAKTYVAVRQNNMNKV